MRPDRRARIASTGIGCGGSSPMVSLREAIGLAPGDEARDGRNRHNHVERARRTWFIAGVFAVCIPHICLNARGLRQWSWRLPGPTVAASLHRPNTSACHTSQRPCVASSGTLRSASVGEPALLRPADNMARRFGNLPWVQRQSMSGTSLAPLSNANASGPSGGSLSVIVCAQVVDGRPTFQVLVVPVCASGGDNRSGGGPEAIPVKRNRSVQPGGSLLCICEMPGKRFRRASAITTSAELGGPRSLSKVSAFGDSGFGLTAKSTADDPCERTFRRRDFVS